MLNELTCMLGARDYKDGMETYCGPSSLMLRLASQ